MRSVLTIALMALLSLPAFGSDGGVRPEAPRLSLQELLQAPEGTRTSWSALHGKVVVLEFWATWCGPCVANIPHLNQLADQFAGKVQFIAIDDEPASTVRHFLTTHPMHAWIGLDQAQKTFSSYHVKSRPMTVVIDASGHVLKTGVPEDVTPRFLAAALRSPTSQPEANKPQQTAAAVPAAAPPSLPRFNLSIREASADGHFLMASDNGTVQARSATPVQILGLLYGANGPDIVLEAKLSDYPLDLQADAPGVKEAAMLKATQAAFSSTFQIEPHWEQWERDVYVLKADSTAKDKLPVSAKPHGYMMLQGAKLEDMDTAMAQFAAQLGTILKTPVVDATGMEARYDIALTLNAGTEEEVAKQIGSLGLNLEHERRSIRSLVVSPSNP